MTTFFFSDDITNRIYKIDQKTDSIFAIAGQGIQAISGEPSSTMLMNPRGLANGRT